MGKLFRSILGVIGGQKLQKSHIEGGASFSSNVWLCSPMGSDDVSVALEDG
jgi:hypothetical protein